LSSQPPYRNVPVVSRRAVIVQTARSPIGRAFKGSLTEVRPDDLAAYIVRSLLDRVPELDEAEIDDLICGAASEGGEQAMNLGRLVASLAGLPNSVPGTTVNRFCASSLQAIRMAYHAIVAGEGDVFIAAGVECVSRVAGRDFEEKDKNARFVDRERPDYVNDIYIPMGLTAENVAEQWGIEREAMDEYAARSHQRALSAQESGFLGAEVTAVPLPGGGELSRDECPRPGTSAERLAELKPAFKPDGRVTAGNACPLNDGAAAVLVMSDTRARELGLAPKARIIASAVTGLAPEIMGVGPIGAVRKVLAAAGMTIGDVDIVELNEAFASQVLAVCRELDIDVEAQLNPFGGAIALGHPFGMTGARIMATLLNGLDDTGGRYGLETMCVGGGQGMAMIVERL
jgi:acetyl-CoA C-acetyltransferase